ncbi:MAG: hypothetical protein KDD59_14210, partial [Bdellovibrionales bacterium]|nr:hypothetical protein [Bdellovibrionales bacterium]
AQTFVRQQCSLLASTAPIRTRFLQMGSRGGWLLRSVPLDFTFGVVLGYFSVDFFRDRSGSY